MQSSGANDEKLNSEEVPGSSETGRKKRMGRDGVAGGHVPYLLCQTAAQLVYLLSEGWLRTAVFLR